MISLRLNYYLLFPPAQSIALAWGLLELLVKDLATVSPQGKQGKVASLIAEVQAWVNEQYQCFPS